MSEVHGFEGDLVPRRGRPRIPAEQQKRRLLRAAERVFEGSPADRVSVQEIVREARMSSRSFYEHFDSKEDLVLALAHEIGDDFVIRLQAALSRSAAAPSLTRRLVDAYLDGMPLVLVGLERLGGSIAAQVRAIRAAQRDGIRRIWVAALARESQRAGLADTPPIAPIDLVLAGLEEMAVQVRSAERSGSDHLRGELTAVLLRGLGPEPHSPDG